MITSLDKSMLIEAAAGTGKTKLIIDRILHGLGAGKFRVPRLVAITFTEKAAGELQSRLRAGLSKSLQDERLAPTQRENLKTALDEIDRANISTIHSFCAGLLRERSIDAAIDPEFEVLDQLQADVLMQQCWERWMLEQVRASPPALVEILRAGVRIEAGSPRPSSLRKLSQALIATPEALDTVRFPLRRPDKPNAALAARLWQVAPAVQTFLQSNRKTRSNRTFRQLNRLLCRLQEVDASDVKAILRLAYRLCSLKTEEALTSLKRAARDEAQAMLGALSAVAAQISAHVAVDVFDWLRGFADFYRNEKAKRAVLDFGDLLVLTARMLRDNRPVRAYFKGRFDVFFVDEFQDTDPLQAEIIAFLCERRDTPPADSMEEVRLEDGKLFVVGDPKQSIYRFRRADVQVYERFKRLFGTENGGGRVGKMYRNWRSTPALLKGFNDIFSRVFVPPEREDVYQAEHVELRSPAGKWPVSEDAPGILVVCPPPNLLKGIGSAREARRYEAHYLALSIKALVEGTLSSSLSARQSFGDIACLFRALTDVDIYEEALERYGIPYRVLGGKNFYVREETGETVALLRAVDDPLDEVAVVAALRSSYFAVSDEDLFSFREQGGRWNYLLSAEVEGPAGEAMALLRQWHRRRNMVPPHVLLGEVLDCTKALEAYLLKPLGQQRAANLQKLLAQLRALWSASQGSFRSTVGYLASLQEQGTEEEESSVVEPGDDFVRVMSIHKAKGLQFGTAALPDLARPLPRRDKVGPLLVDRQTGRIEVRPAAHVSSCGYEELAEHEHENIRAECARLLYVASTRAERFLLLPLYWRKSVRETPDSLLALLEKTGCFAPAENIPYGERRGPHYYVDTRRWQREVSLAEGLPEAASAAPEESCQDLLRQRQEWLKRRTELIERAAAVPPILRPSAVEGDFVPSALAEESAGGGRGKGFGALFHNVMRTIPLLPQEQGGDFEQLVQRTARLEASALGLEEAAADEAARLAGSAAGNPHFRKLLAGARTVSREVPFCVPMSVLPLCDENAGGYLEGSIDLLLIGERAATILDYKTDAVGPHGFKAVEDRYWPQLALYALALRGCGTARQQTELVLYFVRAGALRHRRLDDELIESVKKRIDSSP